MLTGTMVGGMALSHADAGAAIRRETATPELYEFRTYHLVGDTMKQRLDAYLEGAFIPAARRAGCGPVGAFTVSIGPGSPDVHVLVPHATIADFLALPGKLAADPNYVQTARPFADAALTSPSYVALEVKLMRAFAHFPRIEAPGPTPDDKDRIFEMRTYRSHSEQAGAAKIGMFETGGEIDIFRRVGLTPVFFAQDLTGPRLPSLTYLLRFADLATRDGSWKAFGADPAWQRLIATPGLAETVTGIDNQILRPMRYSQI